MGEVLKISKYIIASILEGIFVLNIRTGSWEPEAPKIDPHEYVKYVEYHRLMEIKSIGVQGLLCIYAWNIETSLIVLEDF